MIKVKTFNFKLLVIFMLIALVLSGVNIGANIAPVNEVVGESQNKDTYYLSVEHSKIQLDQGKAIFLDIRSTDEYQIKHIEKADSTPLEQFECSACLEKKLERYQQEGRILILYDQDGSQSVKAYELLHKKGYKNVYVLEGGLTVWEHASFPLYSNQVNNKDHLSDQNAIDYFTHDLVNTNQYSTVSNAYMLPDIPEEDIDAWHQYFTEQGWAFTINITNVINGPKRPCGGLIIPDNWENDTPLYEPNDPGRSLPDRFDWRDYVVMPPIRNQGSCGSCWAFATVAPLEINVIINQGESLDFSEQWLVSCNKDGWGCGGGPPSCHQYHCTRTDLCSHIGPVFESNFPYVGFDAACTCPPVEPEYRIDTHYAVGGATNEIKNAILDHGPVSTTVFAANAWFENYDGGVFNVNIQEEPTHAVTLVGWDDNFEYEGDTYGVWILRNSWGSNWGENGYMYITYYCSNIGMYSRCVDYPGPDCNSNGINDPMDIASGYSEDCNGNGIPDECDIASGYSEDCNTNGIPDDCDIASGYSEDCNTNGIPDECELDCNTNGIPDDCDIASGYSEDCNGNGIPDECDIASGYSEDCNTNGIPDDCDIADGTSLDLNGNGIPDECEPEPCPCDCAEPPNGIVDVADFLTLLAQWGLPGPCDCAQPPNGVVDIVDFLALLAAWGPCP